MRATISRPRQWAAEPLALGRSALPLLIGFTVIGLLAFSTVIPANSARECALAADVAEVMGGGPFFRNLDKDEIVGQPRLDDSLWNAHCLATFQARGLDVLPAGVDLYAPTRLGTLFSRPYFFDNDHASVDAEPYGSHDQTLRVSVKRQGGHWMIVRVKRVRGWPLSAGNSLDAEF